MLLTLLCMMVMVFGMVSTASALTITAIGTNNLDMSYVDGAVTVDSFQWTGSGTDISWDSSYTQNPNTASEIGHIVGDSSFAGVELWYGGEGGTSLTISAALVDPFDYTKPIYLVIKDGAAHVPVWYVFDLSNWNGLDDITVNGLYPNGGNISHSQIFGTAAVPEPTTLLLLGLGLIGIAGIGRKLKK